MRSVRGTARGRVQGVFYRASFAREAESRGLVGWVRNLPDGRVAFQVQGARQSVDEVITWARQGPRNARVDELVVQEIEVGAGLVGFSVLA